MHSPLVKRLAVGVVALCTLFGATRGTQDAVANGDTRTIEIMQMHTKERVTVTFRRNGRYDERALEQLNWVMRDWRRNEATKMNPRLYDLLWEVHRSTGSREAVRVVSAYRAPQTNAMLRRRSSGVAQSSQHMRGNAVDFYIPDVPADRIRSLGMRMQRGGVGYYPRANTPFIHLDVGGVRHWPRMTRQQLVKLFPDQRTAHIPSDGKPLARFEEARREILARGGTVMGETGTAVASERTGRRSIWAALFGGGGEESDEDVAEANSLDSAGWISPADAQRMLAQSRPPAPAPAAAPEPAPTPPAPVVASVAGSAAPPAAPRPEAVALADVPLPPVAARAEPAPAEAGPQLVWRQGPAGLPSESATASTRDMLAELPLPPRRPVAGESIGSLVTAFAGQPAAPPPREALAQLGIESGPDLRGALSGSATETSPIPAILPPRRQVAAPSTAVASLAAPPATASVSPSPRPAARNIIAIARDERAALRVLFAADAPALPRAGTAVRIADARVRREPQAPAGFVADAGPRIAAGFTKEMPAALSPARFSGPAVAPLQLRR